MSRSVTGLFRDQRHVDRIVGALIDAGFDAVRISAVAPYDQVAGGATPVDQRTTRGRGAGAWLIAHPLQHGLSHEYAQRSQEHVAQGRCLVSVTTDAEDEEARNLMVETGAAEISSAADGTLVPVQRSNAPGGILPD
jgi:hypothetical protein